MKLFIILALCALLACAVQSQAIGNAENSLLPALAKMEEILSKVADKVESAVNAANNAKEQASSVWAKIASKLQG